MSNQKCRNCGSSDIDVDPARGDAVCTNCGTVLEDSIIVSEVQFEENAHGGSSALGQFVSSDSKGGARGFGGSFHSGLGKESREITLRNAKRAISNLAQQLRLNQHCVDTAYNFYKMALSRQLTKGRKNALTVGACVYITCRTEGTPHLLIDFSDVLQVCVYELGRTYLKLSQALCINIPSMDPCMYILRFANRLDFGDKTHEVSMTALRLVQRMKRDFIHSGRRPSGLCGAALLIAARLHEFSRTVADIIKIVKVHESTLVKRLMEFGETPSGSLTLEEFLSVDLEEEQDPPSFIAARKKDKERLQKMMDNEDVSGKLNELQREIDKQLDASVSKKRKRPIIDVSEDFSQESQETSRFMMDSTLGSIQGCLTDDSGSTKICNNIPKGLGPNIASMGLANSLDDSNNISQPTNKQQDDETGEIDLEGIDDAEIDSYIMSETESQFKTNLWTKVNASYLQEQKEKAEKLAKAKEEGQPEKKKRKPSTRKKNSNITANTPGEAIEKMLQEKKISSKINYEVLKSLNIGDIGKDLSTPSTHSKVEVKTSQEVKVAISTEAIIDNSPILKKSKSKSQPKLNLSRKAVEIKEDKTESCVPAAQKTLPIVEENDSVKPDTEEQDDYEDEVEAEAEQSELSLAQMLNHHREDEDYYGDDYYDEY